MVKFSIGTTDAFKELSNFYASYAIHVTSKCGSINEIYNMYVKIKKKKKTHTSQIADPTIKTLRQF